MPYAHITRKNISVRLLLALALMPLIVACFATPVSGQAYITGPLQYVAPVASVGGTLEGNPTPFTIADVNNDGKLDAAVVGVNGGGTVGILLGNGDGTFQAPLIVNSGVFFAFNVALADLNGDGKADLVVTGCTGGNCSASVLLGNGDGTFQTPVLYKAASGVVKVADINGDGKPDLVVLNYCTGISTCSGYGTVDVLLGKGNGTFAAAVTTSTGGYYSERLEIADLNGDGKPDVIVGNGCNLNGCNSYDYAHELTVLIGKGDGTFEAAVGYATGNNTIIDMTLADLNGDGKLDLATISNCTPTTCSEPVSVLLGNGNGTFQAAKTYKGGGTPLNYIVATDTDGDGKPDLLISGFCGDNPQGCLGSDATLFTLHGNGDGTFQPPAILSIIGPYGGPMPLGFADLNNDGKPDLLLENGCTCSSNSLVMSSMLNNSGATATATAVTASKNPVPLFTTITYTAKITGGSGTLGGTVTFADGTASLKTVNVSAGEATYSTSYRTSGGRMITATYSGVYASDGSSRSVALAENVVNPTATALTTSGSPTYVGQSVTFTATVTSKYGTIPNGELVKFYDGTTLLTSVALNSGKATYTTKTLVAKTHGMKAVYAGDTNFATSTGFVTQIVQLYPTTTALMCVPNPSTFGQAVTMTATVKSSGSATPTGKVTFTDGTTWIGTGILSGGVATITRSNLAVGTHPITATYSGDSNSASGKSAVVNQVVN